MKCKVFAVLLFDFPTGYEIKEIVIVWPLASGSLGIFSFVPQEYIYMRIMASLEAPFLVKSDLMN